MTEVMEKKNYQAPRVEIMHMVESCSVLAASGEPLKVTISDTEEITSGHVDAKGFTNKDLWEDD